MIVTIDGPAGTGKSTAARGLAERLGFLFLDTGAMYRVVAWRCLAAEVDLHDQEEAAEVAEGTEIAFVGERTLANGDDVTDRLRTPEVTQAASIVAQHVGVRGALVSMQREMTEGRNIVCEGRDQGTIVFPQAECKFFLTADPVERARRRQQELAAKGEPATVEDLLAQQSARDDRDTRRVIAPLIPADDAVHLDTTSLTTDEVIERLENCVRERLSRAAGSSGM